MLTIRKMSQSLFYWIIYSYIIQQIGQRHNQNGLNPYFTGLSILILKDDSHKVYIVQACLNPYFTGLSILMTELRKNIH